MVGGVPLPVPIASLALRLLLDGDPVGAKCSLRAALRFVARDSSMYASCTWRASFAAPGTRYEPIRGSLESV